MNIGQKPKTLAVLQARMSSSRLPGKVLQPLLGVPMIMRQIERISQADLVDELIVATSIDPTDDILAELLKSEGIKIFRGSLNDVLSRFGDTAATNGAQTLVRLTADCPLASPTIIDAVIGAFFRSEVDYCSNTLEPTFADGLDVEVFHQAALREVCNLAKDPMEREHVTLGIYRRPEIFSLANVRNSFDFSLMRWTVDTSEDYAFVCQVYEALYPANPYFDFLDVLELLSHRPELVEINQGQVRNSSLVSVPTVVPGSWRDLMAFN